MAARLFGLLRCLLFSLYIYLLVSPCCLGFQATTTGNQRKSSCSSSSSPRVVLNGYKFGDFSKGIITKVTGKKNYEFGDLSRWLDQHAKESVKNFTNKTEGTYEFGDITRELVRRLKEREYTMEDIMLVLKIVAVAGLNFAPIASILPGKVLMEILEVSIAQSVGEKVIGTVTTELDQRMKEMVTGDKDYKFGDITKKAVTGDKNYRFGDFTRQALLGKKDYEFGDLSRAAFSKLSGSKPEQKSSPLQEEGEEKQPAFVAPDQQTLDTLEEWDKKFLTNAADSNDNSNANSRQALAKDEIQKWDEQLRRETGKKEQ